MNVLLGLIPAKARKWLYAVTASVNGVAVAVLPLLVTLEVIPNTIADQILLIIGAVLGIFSGVVATANVPKSDPTGN